jgi:hypothetical protein
MGALQCSRHARTQIIGRPVDGIGSRHPCGIHQAARRHAGAAQDVGLVEVDVRIDEGRQDQATAKIYGARVATIGSQRAVRLDAKVDGGKAGRGVQITRFET